jgi:hypothetical protein
MSASTLSKRARRDGSGDPEPKRACLESPTNCASEPPLTTDFTIDYPTGQIDWITQPDKHSAAHELIDVQYFCKDWDGIAAFMTSDRIASEPPMRAKFHQLKSKFPEINQIIDKFVTDLRAKYGEINELLATASMEIGDQGHWWELTNIFSGSMS